MSSFEQIELKTLRQRVTLYRKTLKEIRDGLFVGKCENCEGYEPNCDNQELCNLQQVLKAKINEVLTL